MAQIIADCTLNTGIRHQISVRVVVHAWLVFLVNIAVWIALSGVIKKEEIGVIRNNI